MNLKSTTEDQMGFFKNHSLSWICVLLLSLVACACFSGYGYLSILITSLVLILSSGFFIFSKEKKQVLVSKQVLGENSVQDESVISQEDSPPPQVDEVILVSKHQPQSETIEKNHEAQETVVVDQIHDCLATRSPDSYSESESLDQSSTSEDSDVYWTYSGNVGPTTDCSDGSISDEDSLIEIALPSGHYVNQEEEDPKLNLQHKLPNLSTDTIFSQHGLMEFLAEINEMNEEENLIEIDISMGSIKCSRIEIEA